MGSCLCKNNTSTHEITPAFKELMKTDLATLEKTPKFLHKYSGLARVVSVYDGDTITVMTDPKVKFVIRILGIDTPELKRGNTPIEKIHAKACKYLLEDLLLGKAVMICITKEDKYGGRWLAHVTTMDRINVSEFMLRKSSACEYNGNTKTKNFNYDQQDEDYIRCLLRATHS